MVSLHTSPLDPPGSGDSGGMNVYVREVAERLARQGVRVDVFTRRSGGDGRLAEEELVPGARVVEVPAGPAGPLPKHDLPGVIPQFLGGILERGARGDDRGHGPYDVVHSHYWLSGWVGESAKQIWGVPLVASFHTLGKVKEGAQGPGEPPEPAERARGEARVVARADRILAPTTSEVEQLVGLYGADRGRIRVIPPGVDHGTFFPRDREEARARLRLSGSRIALFVGRMQPHKGPDVAVRAVAEAIARDPVVTRDLVLVMVGGPSGPAGGAALAEVMALAAALGLADRVVLLPPQPQRRLADLYAAAEALLVPSRSESFGLVALEAQATGTPVIAADVGGLRHVVEDGRTGFLVPGSEPGAYADRLLALLRDPAAGRRLGERAVVRALRFSWDATARATLDVYRELLGGPA